MDLTGTPGLVGKRGGVAVLEREQVSAPMRFALPPAPIHQPAVLPPMPERRPTVHLADPAAGEMFQWRPEQPEDGRYFPAWLLVLGLVAFCGTMGIGFFGILVPAGDAATPVWVKAAVPVLALAYVLQRPGIHRWLEQTWAAGKHELAVRTHQFKRLGTRSGLGGKES